MNDSTEELTFAYTAENQSLGASLLALRHRKRQRQLTRFAIPGVAIAAVILLAAILRIRIEAPKIAQEKPPLSPLVVRTHPVADGIIVRSRTSPEIVANSSPVPSNIIARTDRISSAKFVVTSRASTRLEFLSDRQLLIALRDHPAILAKTPNGDTHLIFLEERDRNLIWEP